MRDKQSGMSRGFGFITYHDPAAADRVLATPSLELRSRKLDCKLAVPKHLISETLNPQSHRTKKMFVGGLASDVTVDQFRQYFEQWGRVQDSVVMIVRTPSHAHSFSLAALCATPPPSARIARARILLLC